MVHKLCSIVWRPLQSRVGQVKWDGFFFDLNRMEVLEFYLTLPVSPVQRYFFGTFQHERTLSEFGLSNLKPSKRFCQLHICQNCWIKWESPQWKQSRRQLKSRLISVSSILNHPDDCNCVRVALMKLSYEYWRWNSQDTSFLFDFTHFTNFIKCGISYPG